MTLTADAAVGGLAAVLVLIGALWQTRQYRRSAAEANRIAAQAATRAEVNDARQAIFAEVRYYRREALAYRRSERICRARLDIIERLLREHGIPVPAPYPIEVLPDELDDADPAA